MKDWNKNYPRNPAVLKETLLQIARTLIGIDSTDLTTAEWQIFASLQARLILMKDKNNIVVFRDENGDPKK